LPCLKLTPTMVRIGTRSPEEVNRTEEGQRQWPPSQNMHLKGKWSGFPISKLTITKTGHRPTQFKKITDALSVLCADKNFRGLDEVFRTGRDLVETDFMPTYPDATQWSTTHHVQISTVSSMDVPFVDGSRPNCFEVMEQTNVFDANFQRERLLYVLTPLLSCGCFFTSRRK